MIKNDFYNDPDWVWQRGNGVFTKPIVDLSRTYSAFLGAETDWAAPYYMGYIPWTDFPQHFTPFSISIDNDAQNIIFNNLCAGKNIPWFYTCFKQSYSGTRSYIEMIVPDDVESSTSIWKNRSVNETDAWVSNTSGNCLINEMEIIKCTQGGTFSLYYMCFKVDQVNGVSDIYSGTKDLTFAQMKDFFEGTGTLSLNIAGQSTLDVNSSMLADNNCLIYPGSTYKYVFMCGGIEIPHKMCNANGYVYDNYLDLKIGFRLPLPERNTGNYNYTVYYIPNGKLRTMGIDNAPCLGFRRADDTMVKRDAISQHVINFAERYFGGLNDTISFSDFPDDPGADRTEYKWDERGYLFKTSHPYNIDCDMYWSANWRSCYNFILMLNKFDETTGGYPASSSTYDLTHPVAMFNSNDDPTGESVNETYARVEPKLREWQKEGKSISDDDFNVDNMPEDEPTPDPRPEPDPPDKDTENGGDDIELPDTTGLGGGFMFTTQYALRGSQLTELGSKLWGFDVQDYYKNFIYSVDPDTGSVKMEDVFNFFISLRAYPFPIGNYASPAGTNMYIGSGTVPITFTSNIHVADTYLITIDAGKLSLPFWYNDFRDYQTTITLYLPYCGTAELNPADVMGGTLYAVYSVDLSTGACTAYVTCDTWDGKKTVVAILDGQMGADIPLTASNAGRVAARVMSDKINFAENIIGGLKSAAAGIGGVMSGNWAGAIQQGFNVFFGTSLNNEKQLAGMGERGAIAAPMLAGGRGLAAFKNPATVYLQVRGAIYPDVENYAASVGDPAAKTVRVGDCDGFCQFVNVNTDGIITDAADAAAIRDALAAGIYIN